MPDLRDQCLVLKIEGLPGAHCWRPDNPDLLGGVPDYGVALGYTATLRDPLPSATSARWNPLDFTSSIGSWTFYLAPDPNLYRIQPRPIGRVGSTPIEATTDPEPLHDIEGATTLGGVGAYVIIDRETLRVTAESGTFAAAFARAQFGSEAQTHKVGAYIWAVESPPALAGRLVTLYRVPRTGGSQAGSEVQANVLLRGRIPPQGDVVQERGHRIKLTVEDRGSGAELGRDDVEYRGVLGWVPATNTPTAALLRRADSTEVQPAEQPAPQHAALGGYLYFPELGVVCSVPYSEGRWQAHEARLVDFGDAITQDQFGPYPAYQVIWSDERGRFPTFGRMESGVFVPSSNPGTIAANIMLSRDGSNGDYDRGAHLYPSFSLGLDRDRLDWPFWQDCIAALGYLRARSLWLGGPKSRKAFDVVRGLLALGGFTLIVTRAGLYRPVRLGDIYPGEGREVAAAEGLAGWSAVGRALDNLVLEADPGPDQESRRSVTINDLTAAEWFPRESGGSQTLPLAPYRGEDLLSIASEIATALGGTLKRYAQRQATAKARFGPTAALGMEPGDALLVTDPVMRDPTTGLRDQGALACRPTQVNGDVFSGQADTDLVILASDLRIALRAPSAEVTAWDADALTLTVKRWRYAKRGQLDAHQFAAGQTVALYDRNGVARSDPAQTITHTLVDSISGVRRIVLSNEFFDVANDPVIPVAGDIVSFANYTRCRDDGTDDQVDEHAFQAEGGLADAEIAGDEAYRLGD